MYLKNDGIYARSVNGGSERKLADGAVSLSSRFSISEDGTLIVWTKPGEGTVEIYTIATPLALTQKSRLKVKLLDPFFAGGDNRSLVGIAHSPSILDTYSLVLVDVKSLAQTELLSLSVFDPSQIFLSDIRQ